MTLTGETAKNVSSEDAEVLKVSVASLIGISLENGAKLTATSSALSPEKVEKSGRMEVDANVAHVSSEHVVEHSLVTVKENNSESSGSASLHTISTKLPNKWVCESGNECVVVMTEHVSIMSSSMPIEVNGVNGHGAHECTKVSVFN